MLFGRYGVGPEVNDQKLIATANKHPARVDTKPCAMFDQSVMEEDSYLEQEPSLSQLFDAIEGKLDEMMGATVRYIPTNSCCSTHSRWGRQLLNRSSA